MVAHAAWATRPFVKLRGATHALLRELLQVFVGASGEQLQQQWSKLARVVDVFR